MFFFVKQRPAQYLEVCHRELCSRELVLFWLYGSSHVSVSKSATLILFSFGCMNLSMNLLSNGNNKLVPFLGGKKIERLPDFYGASVSVGTAVRSCPQAIFG